MDASLNIPPATPEIVWAMLRDLAERQAETDRQIKQVNQQLGGIAYNQGRFAEAYFFNSAVYLRYHFVVAKLEVK